MKLKKAISILLVLSMLASFAVCFSVSARTSTEIGKAYISFVDYGVRTQAGGTFADPIGTIYGKSEVVLYAGDSVEDITRDFIENTKKANIEIATSGGKHYLKALKNAITDSGTEIPSLGEGDCGAQSGWMVKLNGRVCTESLDQIFVDTNNEIVWCYTCQNGADIGADFSKPSAAIVGLTISPGELSPAFSTGVKDYSVSLPANVETVSVEAFAENAAAEITYTLHHDGKEIEYKPYLPIPIHHFDLIVVASKCYDPQSGTVLTDTVSIRIYQDSPKPMNFFRALILGIIDFFKNLFNGFIK